MRAFIKADGSHLHAIKLLGTGGQGEVWLTKDNDVHVAAKIYHPNTATKTQKELLMRLVDMGAPAPQFLWPIAMIEDPQLGTFGYIMGLREPHFHSLEDFMARRIEPSIRAILTAGKKLADSFLRLHSHGLCYRDISFANIFINPKSGDVRICDNDNVDASGAQSGGVLGTPRFMAPEVVRREAKPSADTDRYSLAVLLFYMLFGGHPLDGAREAKIRCLDVPAMEALYGTKPLYIWDTEDSSNRPVPGVQDNPIAFKNMYPKLLADLFERSFTEGLIYPVRRVRESEWRKAFAAALDNIWECSCGAESFYDPSNPTTHKTCWACQKKLALPPRIRIEDRVILLNRTSQLLNYHLGLAHDDDTPAAEVVENPARPGVFGLRNLGIESWSLTKPDGSIVDVEQGRTAPIISGNRVNFGQVIGEIRT